MIEKLCVLGGSSAYTPLLIEAIINQSLKINNLILYGRTEDKLELISGVCRSMTARSGYEINIQYSSDLREALDGSDYVLCQVRVGGMEARTRDELVPPAFGLLGDETLAAGGVANGLRTFPVIREYVDLISELCPEARMICLTNPMSMLMTGISAISDLEVIGTCDLPYVLKGQIANILEVPVDEMEMEYFGLNHLGFIRDVNVNGQSRFELLRERVVNDENPPFDKDIVRIFNMIPARYLNYVLHYNREIDKQTASPNRRGEQLVQVEKDVLEYYRKTPDAPIPEPVRARNACWYEINVVPVLRYWSSDEGGDIIACTENRGSITGLPDGDIVEVETHVSDSGIETKPVGEIPEIVLGIYQQHLSAEKQIVRGMIQGSRDIILQGVTGHPMIRDLNRAEKFLDHIIKTENLPYS